MEEIQIESNDTHVWVNTTGAIGRFNKNGFEVHKKPEEQMETGEECIECYHGKTEVIHWRRWVQEMKKHHDVDIDDDHMPLFLRMKFSIAETGRTSSAHPNYSNKPR